MILKEQILAKKFNKDFGFSKWDNSSEVYIKDFGKRDENSRELERYCI